MSCWQSTIMLLLVLYHHEKALPCVRPVGPIYGPIACNVLILTLALTSFNHYTFHLLIMRLGNT